MMQALTWLYTDLHLRYLAEISGVLLTSTTQLHSECQTTLLLYHYVPSNIFFTSLADGRLLLFFFRHC